ncbi:plasma-membrane choline transporter family protein isoform X2 [Tasmannia lanceolata]|uniref:plasma-membrane choline transporter family protein isoform X2 n=1 Tax=Tasmannia lanceolata TaxID=3420 RepID=UPI0040634951
MEGVGDERTVIRDQGEEKDEKYETEKGVDSSQKEKTMSKLQTSNPIPPIQVVIPGPSPLQTPSPIPSQSRQTPQPSLASLNSRAYTNRISLVIFLIHMVAAIGAVSFLGFKAIQGVLRTGASERREKRMIEFWLPQIEGSALISIILAWAWQKLVREFPTTMVHFILWTSFGTSLTAGVLLLSFSIPATDGVGVALIAFAIGNGLYACWVSPRIRFTGKILSKSLQPVAKFPDINHPMYWMLGIAFMWMSLWTFAVIGALNFKFPALTILALVLSLAWTTEVTRNVANLTASRAIALYYLRGMQSDLQVCFQRSISRNLGSACLGSLFLPTIEALRIIARILNLLQGEDEFMFSCAHCCLKVMDFVFHYGNSWAFVHVAAYGKGLMGASVSTWNLFERNEMEPLVDSDITSAICFLTGVASGSICVIFSASWTFAEHKSFTATVSLLAFFIGYLMVIDISTPFPSISSSLCLSFPTNS